jgi:hypothetical protein
MTLEIRLLSFSTGQPHPLAEKSIIFITTKSLLLGRCNVVVDIVGEFLALLITYPMARSESEDAFFLVRWKKGEVYRVSVRRLRHVPSPLLRHSSYCILSVGYPNGEPTHFSVSSRKTPS